MNKLRIGEFLITLPDIDRFFKSINKTDKCWVWEGYKDSNGYGRVTIRGEGMLCHVVSYVLHYGSIPDGIHVLHHCDNPPCVNPTHLFLGTHQMNMTDRNIKGRCGKSGRFGEAINGAKLTAESAIEIRACVSAGVKQAEMARRYNVSKSTINSLIIKRTWKQA